MSNRISSAVIGLVPLMGAASASAQWSSIPFFPLDGAGRIFRNQAVQQNKGDAPRLKRHYLFFVLLTLIILTAGPTLYAQECKTSCQSYSACTDSCYYCYSDGPLERDNPCPYQEWTTCGDRGLQCGGCAITNTWEEDQEIYRSPMYYVCGDEETWYHYHNRSVFLKYQKQMRHVTYGTQVCNGVRSTVVISQYNFVDYCYDFRYGDCFDTTGNAYNWIGVDSFGHEMECHW